MGDRAPPDIGDRDGERPPVQSNGAALVEIDVDVAQGSEPETVVSLLQAAAREVTGVMASPPPVATLSDVSTGSLKFSLEAWVDDYAGGRAIESALRMGVVKKLAEAGIEIAVPVP